MQEEPSFPRPIGSRLPGRLALALLVAGLLGFVHARPHTGQAAVASKPSGYDPLTTRTNEEGSSGERLYVRYCAGCHGEAGDGKGPAAAFLAPRPRDFTKGIFKFTSTPAGSIPLDEDIYRTITFGLHGTSMPGWRLLPEKDRWSLARHVKTFHKEWEFRNADPPVPFHSNPFDMTDRKKIDAALQLGSEVYHKLGMCWSCHPAYVPRKDLETMIGSPARADLELALGKPDSWGETILPPDFRRNPLKSVRELRDLYSVVTAGVGGTAMPTWKSSFTGEQLWALTLYVDSLRPGSVVTRTIEKLGKEAP
jgi:mono/diheme cytochrome c family protein